ncbi:hypothetical protein NHX12_019291 [Muraenolepis orangiensis]|uniref:C-type lectin domain-containing protein n=1 Tax=Muraenolepis orangiensis TaxID=630683 RepID=A0A9Q0ETB8_9TELE|nr:hypothetical protein NHX12_019291 [Muraenolepis orangiensis]
MRLSLPLGSKSKEEYLQPLQNTEHVPYILELNYLRENHSEVIKATGEAEKALEGETVKNEELRQRSEEQKFLNDNLQGQVESGRTEKTKLAIAKLQMGNSCGHCKEGWVLLNSTCYFFSNFLLDSPTRKNWPDSRQDCISRKADLVVIESWEEQRRHVSSDLPGVTADGSQPVWGYSASSCLLLHGLGHTLQPADKRYTSEQRWVKKDIGHVQEHAGETEQGHKRFGKHETAAQCDEVGAGAPEEKRQGLQPTTRHGAQGERSAAVPSGSDE